MFILTLYHFNEVKINLLPKQTLWMLKEERKVCGITINFFSSQFLKNVASYRMLEQLNFKPSRGWE